MIIELKSVGCQIDTDTLLVSRIMKDTIRKPQHGIEFHIDDVDDEWFYRLDDDDFGTIDNLINNRPL
jgi:hypothetical protein